MSELAQKECKPCKGGEDPLKGDDLKKLYEQLPEGWNLVEEHHLEKEFKFDDFRGALEFTKRVGEMAEEQNHHPDILLSYGKVKITVFTHKIGGLSDSDFVFAAKADELKEG